MTPLWSRKMLPPQEPMFAFTPMSVTGPISGTGEADVMEGDAGFWRVTFGSVVVNNTQRVQTWNAYSALFNGRYGSMIVPYCRGNQPLVEGLDAPYDEVLFDDDASFDDDSGFVGGVIDVRMAADVAKRVAVLPVAVYRIGAVQPGHRFSIGERFYEIRSIIFSSETQAVIKIRPPLRESVLAGAELNFDDPVCRVRLMTDTAMDLALKQNRGLPTVTFVEDLRK